MRNNLLFFLFLLIPGLLSAQSITGKIVSQDGEGISGLQVKLCISPNSFNALTAFDGTFSFSNITGVDKDESLPSGYLVSDNFPNPFNPRTRINITVPENSNIQIELFNTLGQRVNETINKSINAGSNFVDLELNGLPNGIYVTKIEINHKYTVKKKIMLVYGTQHLNSSVNYVSNNGYENSLKKSTLDIKIDSLVVTGAFIEKSIFTNFPVISGNSLDLGNLMVTIRQTSTPCPASITYAGKEYKTVQIGSQCWFRENLDIGTMVDGSLNQSDNGNIEKYCYGNDPVSCTTLGGLYQWDEAIQYKPGDGKVQGICPDGWHIPSASEFQNLTVAVNNDGNALKALGQGTQTGVGTNTSGFSALLGGNCYNGYFYSSSTAGFWSSTGFNAANAEYLYLSYFLGGIYDGIDEKSYGFSIRCIKDN